jgi:hypothetical protein
MIKVVTPPAGSQPSKVLGANRELEIIDAGNW